MKSKYYTPEIEEFHIRFRYEAFTEDWDSGELMWNKKTFPEAPELCSTEGGRPDLVECFYQKFEDPEYCRVKYLDQSDIEELGWVVSKDNKEFKKGNVFLIVGEIITIEEFQGFADNGGWEYQTLFSGKIKNYNNLKTIMEQIGIT